MENKVEFDGVRAKLYEKAMSEYPLSRVMDIETMYKYLNPKINNKILGIGEGNGYFCNSIASSIGANGIYFITDPSKDQLINIKKKLNYPQIKIEVMGADELDVPKNFFDKVWSFGAFHHCKNKIAAMKNVFRALKPGGIAVICDVFFGSKLANHFDIQVAKYCITGHDVEFMTDESAKKLCADAGFILKNIIIKNLPQKWIFNSEYELGDFIYKLHAMTKIHGKEDDKIKEVIRGCKEILGVEKVGNHYELNWPMKVLIAKK